MASADSKVTKRAAEAHLYSYRHVGGIYFGLLFLFKDGFIKFIVIVLLIHLSIQVRVIEDSVELQMLRLSLKEVPH
jgi:hypothetical protein